ncbi:hypothetical protein KQH97_00560 [Ruminococcus sp. MSJ-25]|uniref:hypothetical protein n=1 Tax=Ruminococcus sp. MSJ-25 TaxID=2841536 RepID=UPI001C0FEEDD|nr:hypothetical protein [Ruminococcus sp. MSJ-25]MBU5406786.1 hypothetical protein [Ruminococcus sp. MSJ-25]
MKNTIKAIAALLISATMISITACGNTDTTSSAPPKATTTASSTKASATTTTEATLTSQSEETTSLSATTTGTSASTKSTSSSKSSTTPKNTAKANSSKASNGGTVNNNQSYSGNTTNNGNGNYNYQPAETQAPQTERQTKRQTERQTQKQTTTTAKKTQAPKPKPTTTTTAKPKVNLTQSDIDRLQKELQAYSNELARPRVEKIYTNGGYSSADEYMADLADVNLNTASWTSGDNIYAHEKYNDVLQSLKEEIQDEYNFYSEEYLHQSVIIIQAGTDYYGHSCWNTYLLRA